MNIKSAVRYHLFDMSKSLIIFYSIIISITVFFGLTTNMFGNFDGNVSGMDSASIIFIFVVGLNLFRAPFQMLLQNGVSRFTLFISVVIAIASIGAIMAVLDSILAIASNRFMPYESALHQLYGAQNWFSGLIWYWSIYVGVGLTGVLITTLYYRMVGWQKLLVSIGVPALFIAIIPVIEVNFTNGAIYRGIGEFLAFALGFKNGMNPYYAVVTCIIFSGIAAGLSWLLMRRAVVKD